MWVRTFLAGVLPALATCAALAQDCSCGGTRVVQPALGPLLSEKTVCASAGGDSWQEYHKGATGGELIDWKLGRGHPIDPTETVGTWAISNDLVVYAYGTNSYQFQVCQAQNTVNFCSPARSVVGATLRAGQVACSSSPPLVLQRVSPAASPPR